MYHLHLSLLFLVFFLVLPYLSSGGGNYMAHYKRCLKIVEECESSPNLSRCMISQGCHRTKNGKFIVNEKYYEAQGKCIHLLDECLGLLWLPMKNDGYNCTDAVLKHGGQN